MPSLYERRSSIVRLSFLLLLVLSSSLMTAQNQPPDPKQVPQTDQQPAAAPVRRPRIGLALSGGGALGLAEIGVLQWLEQNHIPVDRIAGTSMGSIVAAMYATGMSAAEIQKFAQGIDWDEAMLPESAYRRA